MLSKQYMSLTRVRRAYCEGIEAIRSLCLESDRFFCEQLPGEFKSPEEVSASRNLKAVLEMEPFIVLVAEVSEEVVGFVQGQVHEIASLMCQPRTVGYVNELVVTESQRQQGIGAQLISALESELIARGVSEILLNVYSFNEPARALYQSQGYQSKIQIMAKNV